MAPAGHPGGAAEGHPAHAACAQVDEEVIQRHQQVAMETVEAIAGAQPHPGPVRAAQQVQGGASFVPDGGRHGSPSLAKAASSGSASGSQADTPGSWLRNQVACRLA